MKKVLIIDDSALMRRVMSDIISSEPDVYAVDTAENGKIAVEYLGERKRYDLILLDMNMPKMDGVSFLKYLNENHYNIPTLLVSSIASKSTKETMVALELGAYDFVKKPEGAALSSGEFKEQLLEKVRCAFNLRNVHIPTTVHHVTQALDKISAKKTLKPAPREAADAPAKTFHREHPVSAKNRNGNLIAIASSTGGPKSLQSVIPKFPKDISCPIVVVQHMPAGFTASLAERLDEMSQCRVVEAQDGDVLENGVVYIAKGGYQLNVREMDRKEHCIVLKKDMPRNGLRPCADIFFESLAESGFKKIFCAVLTGMGSDGTKGLIQLKTLKEVYTVGQSENSCVVYGMPRAAAKANVVDKVADLQDVADLLIAALQQNGG